MRQNVEFGAFGGGSLVTGSGGMQSPCQDVPMRCSLGEPLRSEI